MYANIADQTPHNQHYSDKFADALFGPFYHLNSPQSYSASTFQLLLVALHHPPLATMAYFLHYIY